MANFSNSEPTESEPVEATVRQKLRSLRTEQGLTLEAVAERASIDVSTLSRLESGKRRLSLDHLPSLAKALGVSVSELLEAPQRLDPRIKSHPHTHDGLTFFPLTRRGPAGGVYAYKIRIDPARNTPPPELPVHDGHDWMYVLDGRMRLCLGEDDLVINPGEAVEFTTLTPHWFGVVEEQVELIMLLGPHGERLHLHD
jgi:transcriptional regulator with XRE-family HTH domain